MPWADMLGVSDWIRLWLGVCWLGLLGGERTGSGDNAGMQDRQEVMTRIAWQAGR